MNYEAKTIEELEAITAVILRPVKRARKARLHCEACGLVEFDPECPHWDYDSEAGYGAGGAA